MANLPPLGPDVKQHELLVNKETLRPLLRDMAQGVSANKADKKAQHAALELLSNVPPKEATKLLASIKQEYPAGIAEAVKNVARAMFRFPVQGSGAVHQAVIEMERLVEGRERLIAAFQQHKPTEHILRILALYPTSCEMLLKSARKVEGLNTSAVLVVEALFNKAALVFNKSDSQDAMAPMITLVNSTPQERPNILFICKQILLPQVPQEQFQQANHRVKTFEGVHQFLSRTPNLAQDGISAESVGAIFALFSKAPELVPLLQIQIHAVVPQGVALINFERSLRTLLQALSTDDAAAAHKALQKIAPAMQQFGLTKLEDLLKAIQKHDPQVVNDWGKVYNRFALVGALVDLTRLPQMGGEEALTLASKIFQSHPPTPGSAVPAFYTTLVTDRNLRELYNRVTQDAARNTHYGPNLLEPFQIAKELYTAALNSNFKKFKETIETNITRDRALEPNVRFKAVTAALDALIIPTLPPVLQTRFEEYLKAATQK